MLPTKGYFQDIECPYFDNACGRPYCHFRHRKKQLDESSSEENHSSPKIPTYKPTPKSELAVRSHIPISYVPDIIYRADKPLRTTTKTNFFERPIYKPTPKSLLSSAIKNEEQNNPLLNEIKECMVSTKYSPKAENISNIEYQPTALEDKTINKNIEKDRYQPTGDNINNIQYNPTALSEIDQQNYLDDVLDEVYKPSVCLRNNKSNNDFEILNEINNVSDKIKNKETVIKDNLLDEKNNKESSKSKKSNDKEHKSSSKKNDNHKKSTKDKSDEKNDKKHHSKHKSSRTSSEDKKSNSKDSKSSKEESRSKDKKSKHSKDRDQSKDKERNKNKEKDKNHHKEKDKSSKSIENSEKSRSKERSGKDKKSDKKDKDENKSNRHDERKTHKKSSSNHKEIQKDEIDKYTLDDYDLDDDSLANLDLDIDLDEDETMKECYRIFNEYKPPEVKIEDEIDDKIIESNNETMDEPISNKKRIAHSNAPSTSTKFLHPKPKNTPTPGQILANRYKVIQAANEEKMVVNEVQRISKRPIQITSPVIETKKPKISKPVNVNPPKPSCLIDDIINNKTTTTNKNNFRKIAPVMNVMNIQKAKAQLEDLNKKRAVEVIKTAAQTAKSGKRQAHVPEYSLDNIPDVIDSDKSKLSVNVRTRFLTLLGDECCKLYMLQTDAFKRALDEEYACYQKCKVVTTYKNSAMLAVNRLRKELQERETKGLGRIGSISSTNKNKEDSEKAAMYNMIQQYLLTDEELDIHGYPKESTIPGRAFIKNRKSKTIISLPKNQKKCSRCSKIYLVDKEGKVIYEEECIYHPQKKRTIRGESIYLCCKSTDDSGCVTSHTHVSEMPEDAELEGFQITMPPDNENDPRSFAIYALDCEMCYTTKGLELTRVTIVDTNCKTVYESLVKPLSEIIDYNTRFSGITKKQMDKINTGILQVQANILHLCNSKTILIGHSLESDMKALKIVHSSIVDTSVLFPHKMGLPHKRALRSLASEYLNKIIQNDVSGHDSAEDAITCMELVKLKVKEDARYKFNK